MKRQQLRGLKAPDELRPDAARFAADLEQTRALLAQAIDALTMNDRQTFLATEPEVRALTEDAVTVSKRLAPACVS